MSEFFQMGGYGPYIWPAYAISAVVLIGLTAWLIRRRKKLSLRLDALEKQSQDRKGSRSPSA